jgi:hypothetical protein
MYLRSNPPLIALVLLVLVGLGLFPAFVFSQPSFDFRSETIFRVFERDTEQVSSGQVIPVYEYLQFDYGKPEGDGVSFHFNGWGRLDFADSGYFEDDLDGALLYAFMEYVHPALNFETRLGRQQISNIVTTNSVDGLWLSATPIPWFGFSAFGGAPVATRSADDRSSDITYGARMFNRVAAQYEIGLAYKMVTGDMGEDDERLATDLFFNLPGGAILTGYSSQNLITDGWGEHSYAVTFYLDHLDIKPFYQYISYEDFFNSGSFSARPFRFLADTGETMRLIGGDITWQASSHLDISARYSNYDYQIRQERSNYIAGLLNYNTGDALFGGEIGLMDGDTAENSYLLTRAFFYWNQPFKMMNKSMFTGDIVYVLYEEEIFSKKSSLFASLGWGRRFLDDRLELKLSGDYSVDPFFDSDLRGMVTVILRR